MSHHDHIIMISSITTVTTDNNKYADLTNVYIRYILL